MLKSIPWSNREDVQKLVNEMMPNKKKAELIFNRCKEYERMATDGVVQMKYSVSDIEELLDKEFLE